MSTREERKDKLREALNSDDSLRHVVATAIKTEIDQADHWRVNIELVELMYELGLERGARKEQEDSEVRLASACDLVEQQYGAHSKVWQNVHDAFCIPGPMNAGEHKKPNVCGCINAVCALCNGTGRFVVVNPPVDKG